MFLSGTRGRAQLRSKGTQGGAVAVEFALVLPVLLTLVFGLVQYGIYFWSVQGGSSAAREAARLSAVGKPTNCGEFRDYVRARIGSTSSDAGDAEITRTYKREEVSFTPTPANPVKIGDVVTVTVDFQSYYFHFPFVPFIDEGQVTESANSRVDYVFDPDATVACT